MTYDYEEIHRAVAALNNTDGNMRDMTYICLSTAHSGSLLQPHLCRDLFGGNHRYLQSDPKIVLLSEK